MRFSVSGRFGKESRRIKVIRIRINVLVVSNTPDCNRLYRVNHYTQPRDTYWRFAMTNEPAGMNIPLYVSSSDERWGPPVMTISKARQLIGDRPTKWNCRVPSNTPRVVSYRVKQQINGNT